MLRYNLLLAFIVSVVIFTLVAENEVYAAPEPCKELLEMMMKPEKLKKPKDDKKDKDDDKHKRKKDKMKPLEELFEKLLSLK